jgi:Ca2+-binding RTX toxin-like protein
MAHRNKFKPHEPAMAVAGGLTESGATWTILQGQGNVTLTGSGTDTLQFANTAPEDVTLTRSGDDLCIHYGPDETVTVTGQFAGAGVMHIGFGGGIVLAAADLAQLSLQGTDGDDSVTGLSADWSADDVILGLAGNDYIADGDGGSNLLDGGDGDDILCYADVGHSTVIGGAGNDTLGCDYSGDPNQPVTRVDGTALMMGGTGNDCLGGGAGDNLYLFNLGDGNDQVSDLAGIDRFQFGPGIAMADVTFTRQDTTLCIRVRDPANPAATQSILVEAWFGVDGNHSIESFAFDDGSMLDAAQVTTLAGIMRGTTGEDTLFARDDIWLVEALAGNDYISYSPNMPMRVDAGAGNDTLYGAQFPGPGATVVGGAGDDYMLGSCGKEIYLFDHGDGNDTIRDAMYENRVPDRLVFGPGVAAADVTFARNEFDLIVRVGSNNGAPADSIRVVDWFWDSSAFLERAEFADGSQLTMAQISEMGNYIMGTAGNDYLSRADYSRFIDGGAGNDTINGGSKVPVLRGGDGNDSMRFNCTVSCTVDGGSGNDTLSGDYSQAKGTAQLTGGTGDDYISGNPGATSYFFNRGDGRDTIADSGDAAFVDRLIFGSGIVQADVSFERSANDLVLTISGVGSVPDGDRITVTGRFQAPTRVIERLQFADGTALTAAQVSGMVYGTAGPDTLTAPQDQYLLSGLAGSDKLTAGPGGALLAGGAGNDTLTGGAAADFLHGGKGDDTIAACGRDIVGFNAGDGADTLKAQGNGTTLSLGTGIDVAHLTLNHAGADLVLGLGGTDSVTLKDWYAATQPAQGVTRLQTIDTDGAHLYDFRAAVAAFDAAHAAGSGAWAIEAQLSAAAQGSAAGTALGGVLAVDIAAHGTVTLLSPVYETLRSGVFGLDPQTA